MNCDFCDVNNIIDVNHVCPKAKQITLQTENGILKKKIQKMNILLKNTLKQKRNLVNLVTGYITCPISLQVFKNPVMASDGNIYEKRELKNWLKYKRTSPLTREDLKNFTSLIKCTTMRNLTNDVLLNERAENLQYAYIKDYRHERNINKINAIFENDFPTKNTINKILKYREFKLDNFSNIVQVIKKTNISEDAMLHIIDNIIDIEYEFSNNYKLVHYACQYGTPATIKRLIDRGVNLECTTYNDWKPIHFACKYSSPDIIMYMINKGVDIECQTSLGLRPIHLICEYATVEMIKYIIDKEVDLEATTSNNLKPIHLICKHKINIAALKYIIEGGANMETIADTDNLRPIHMACLQSNLSGFEAVKYLIENGVNLEAELSNGCRPIHIASKYSSIETIQYIIDQGVNLECTTKEGLTPSYYIERYSTTEMLMYLKNKIIERQNETI